MYKKSSGLYIFLAVTLICILSVGLHFRWDENITSKSEETTTQKYLLTEYNGQLCYYEAGRASPVHIFDTYLSDLPDEDSSKLLAGIYAKTDEELMSLIEDFES